MDNRVGFLSWTPASVVTSGGPFANPAPKISERVIHAPKTDRLVCNNGPCLGVCSASLMRQR